MPPYLSSMRIRNKTSSLLAYAFLISLGLTGFAGTLQAQTKEEFKGYQLPVQSGPLKSGVNSPSGKYIIRVEPKGSTQQKSPGGIRKIVPYGVGTTSRPSKSLSKSPIPTGQSRSSNCAPGATKAAVGCSPSSLKSVRPPAAPKGGGNAPQATQARQGQSTGAVPRRHRHRHIRRGHSRSRNRSNSRSLNPSRNHPAVADK